jgi:hypothetical protein
VVIIPRTSNECVLDLDPRFSQGRGESEEVLVLDPRFSQESQGGEEVLVLDPRFSPGEGDLVLDPR